MEKIAWLADWMRQKNLAPLQPHGGHIAELHGNVVEGIYQKMLGDVL